MGVADSFISKMVKMKKPTFSGLDLLNINLFYIMDKSL